LVIKRIVECSGGKKWYQGVRKGVPLDNEGVFAAARDSCEGGKRVPLWGWEKSH